MHQESTNAKLQSDVHVLEVMAEGMADYLRGDALFGKSLGRLPKLTLGGYLMRQYRLVALRPLLSLADQERVGRAVAQVEAVLQGQVVRSEARAAEECGARLRQWEEFIRDLRRDGKAQAVYYATAVEPRAMLDQLLKFLATPPYRLDPTLPERLKVLDTALRGLWDEGEFVWAADWEAAYPAADYWWLYGQPIAARYGR